MAYQCVGRGIQKGLRGVDRFDHDAPNRVIRGRSEKMQAGVLWNPDVRIPKKHVDSDMRIGACPVETPAVTIAIAQSRFVYVYATEQSDPAFGNHIRLLRGYIGVVFYSATIS